MCTPVTAGFHPRHLRSSEGQLQDLGRGHAGAWLGRLAAAKRSAAGQ